MTPKTKNGPVRPEAFVRKTFTLPPAVADHLEGYGNRRKSAIVAKILAKAFKIKLDRW